MIYYPFHNIYISFDLQLLALGIHVPPGVTVQLDDDRLQVRSKTHDGIYDEGFTIRAAPRNWIFNPPQFLEQINPFQDSDETNGHLMGQSAGNRLTWYLFVCMDPKDPKKLARTPQGLTDGTVRLPSLTINDQRYEGQILSFKQKHFAGFECALCT
jgi:hypothetical protein